LISHILDEKLVGKDPVSNLYPFMIAASGEGSDLYTIYHLLGRNPSILDILIIEEISEIGGEEKKKQRVEGCGIELEDELV
jgi:hypothetical protein